LEWEKKKKTLVNQSQSLSFWSDARLEIFTARKITASIFVLHPEDEGSMVFRNVGILPHHYTVSLPRKPGLEP
jgi:hypothetical protein